MQFVPKKKRLFTLNVFITKKIEPKQYNNETDGQLRNLHSGNVPWRAAVRTRLVARSRAQHAVPALARCFPVASPWPRHAAGQAMLWPRCKAAADRCGPIPELFLKETSHLLLSKLACPLLLSVPQPPTVPAGAPALTALLKGLQKTSWRCCCSVLAFSLPT